MPVSRTLTLASFGAALIGLLAAGQPASAQVRPQGKAGFGLVVATFALPEGAVTAYLPDDVAPGETFSGTVEGPDGFVLMFGDQRARTGEPFLWTVPAGEPRQRFVITLLDRQGSARARASLQTGAAAPRDAAFRFPPLVQAGKPLPIRGPLDGDFRTTRVEIDGSAVSPLAESIRRVIVRAPSNLMGPASATLTEAGIEHRGAMRSLSIEMAAPAGSAPPASRELTVRGVSGIDRDVPLLVAGDHLYLRATDVAGQPTFTVRREFSGVRADSEAEVVIPQSLREEVAVVLRTPPWSRDVDVARQHGDALNGARLRCASGGGGAAVGFRPRPRGRVRHAGRRRAARPVAHPRVDAGLGNRRPVRRLSCGSSTTIAMRGRRTPRHGRLHCACSPGSCRRSPRSWRCTSWA